MNKYTTTTWIALFALVLAAALILAPAAKATGDPDSLQVSKLLSEAKTQAFQLSEDAAEMESFTWTAWPMSWQSHTEALIKIKDDVNTLGRQLVKLDEARKGASAWQRTVIDRITPLLKELAANTSGAIGLINANAKSLSNEEYVDYIEANADTSARLASLVSDFVDYGKTKDRLERLTNRLEVRPK